MPILFKSEYLKQDVFIWQLSETEEQLQALVPKETIPDYSFPSRRLTWLGARCLLNTMYQSTPLLTYNKHGKPEVDNNDHISISHSGNLVTIARSNNVCGIDIQQKSEKIAKILPKFLNEEELIWLNTKNQTNDYHHLIWCAKEAIFKVYGFDVDFKKDISILDFNIQKSGKFEAKVSRNEETNVFTLAYQLLGEYYLVFTHE
ncbi:MAG: 4'-phosphopantetheinyl transferase [Flavobacteriales bacterium]|jgi:4'-phosphopantetheinyl transferase